MSNVKPGDLAVLVGGYPENLGAIVEVVESDLDATARWKRQVWIVMVTGRKLRVQPRDGSSRRKMGRGRCAALDTHLRPVSGLPIDEDVTEELHA